MNSSISPSDPSFLTDCFNQVAYSAQQQDPRDAIVLTEFLCNILETNSSHDTPEFTQSICMWLISLLLHTEKFSYHSQATKYILQELCFRSISSMVRSHIAGTRLDGPLSSLLGNRKALLSIFSAIQLPLQLAADAYTITPHAPINPTSSFKHLLGSSISISSFPPPPADLSSLLSSNSSVEEVSSATWAAAAACTAALALTHNDVIQTMTHNDVIQTMTHNDVTQTMTHNAVTHPALFLSLLRSTSSSSSSYVDGLFSLVHPVIVCDMLGSSSTAPVSVIDCAASIARLLFRHNAVLLELLSPARSAALAEAAYSILASPDCVTTIRTSLVRLLNALAVFQPSTLGHILSLSAAPSEQSLVTQGISTALDHALKHYEIDPDSLAALIELVVNMALQKDYIRLGETAESLLASDTALQSLLRPLKRRPDNAIGVRPDNGLCGRTDNAMACALTLLMIVVTGSIGSTGVLSCIRDVISDSDSVLWSLLGLHPESEDAMISLADHAEVCGISIGDLRSKKFKKMWPASNDDSYDVSAMIQWAADRLSNDASSDSLSSLRALEESVRNANSQLNRRRGRLAIIDAVHKFVGAALLSSTVDSSDKLPLALSGASAAAAAMKAADCTAPHHISALAKQIALLLSCLSYMATSFPTHHLSSADYLLAAASSTFKSVQTKSDDAYSNNIQECLQLLLASILILLQLDGSAGTQDCRMSLFRTTALHLEATATRCTALDNHRINSLAMSLSVLRLLVPSAVTSSDTSSVSSWRDLTASIQLDVFLISLTRFLSSCNQDSYILQATDYSKYHPQVIGSSSVRESTSPYIDNAPHIVLQTHVLSLLESMVLFGCIRDELSLAQEMLLLLSVYQPLKVFQDQLFQQDGQLAGLLMGYDARSKNASEVACLWEIAISLVSSFVQTCMLTSSSLLQLVDPLSRFVNKFKCLLLLPIYSAKTSVSRQSLQFMTQSCRILNAILSLPLNGKIIPSATEAEFLKYISDSVVNISRNISTSRGLFVPVTAQDSQDISSVDTACESPFHLDMERASVIAMVAAVSVLRLGIPSQPLIRDDKGCFPVGSIVFYRSRDGQKGSTASGVIEAMYDTSEGYEYDIRLKDGTKDFGVDDSAVVYTAAPKYNLEGSNRADELLRVASQSLHEHSFGTTSDLLSMLRYSVSRETDIRLKNVSMYLETLAEQVLSILVINILHLRLGPVDKVLVESLVKDIFSAINADASSAEWTKSTSWSKMIQWTRYLLPMPEEPEDEEEEQIIPVPAVQRSFKKGGQLRAAITYVTERESLD